MGAVVHEIERDDLLRRGLWDAYRSRYGYVSPNTTVADMVRRLGLKETMQRMDMRHATLEFDGEYLRWIENGMAIRYWNAVSGRPGYQDKQHQREKNKGPLPEGRYIARQSELQRWEDYSFPNRHACILRALGLIKLSGAWSGCQIAWGDRRIWLNPGPETQTYGRKDFSIHGGTIPGSAGCIDLTSGLASFVDAFIKYGKDMDVLVRY